MVSPVLCSREALEGQKHGSCTRCWRGETKVAGLQILCFCLCGSLEHLDSYTSTLCIEKYMENIENAYRCFLLVRTKSIRTRMCFSISCQNKWWIRLCFHAKSKREIVNAYVFKIVDSLQRKTSKLSACVSTRTWECARVSAWKPKNDHGTRMRFHTTCLLHQETRMC